MESLITRKKLRDRERDVDKRKEIEGKYLWGERRLVLMIPRSRLQVEIEEGRH
jgi:hypothetical protein